MDSKRSKSHDDTLTSPRRPRLVVTLGRGNTGKSVMLAWIAETAEGTIPLEIIDADPNNQSLMNRFPDRAKRPPVIEGEDRRLWIEEQINRMVVSASEGQPFDMLLDLGGGDHLMKRLGSELQFVDMLDEAGVDITAIHMIGPNVEDLSFLTDVEARRLFCPKRTLVVMNAGLVTTGLSAQHAFDQVFASRVLSDVMAPERGGRLIVMPPLPCMDELDKHGIRSFSEALTPQSRTKIGLFNATRVLSWTRQMMLIRADIGEWIP